MTSAITRVKEGDFNNGRVRNAVDLVEGKVAGLVIMRVNGSDPNSRYGFSYILVTTKKGKKTIAPCTILMYNKNI
ncbi:hypothetical protein [Flavivirga sp. 57AJ16]|uniref:hypothetical protein n=1 Tax=Flavivirga sp. 57AJ16 TaxID=3025307 RepID=UPI002366D7F5|nr:hypothetical protein [Flavivirga sp. 57AJ16]MDD7885123.1 hypothetical protein [Flavivirga sp. 57AJ16]